MKEVTYQLKSKYKINLYETTMKYAVLNKSEKI